jgi:hypothetical protein
MVSNAVGCGFAGLLADACSVSDRLAPSVAALRGTSVARVPPEPARATITKSALSAWESAASAGLNAPSVCDCPLAGYAVPGWVVSDARSGASVWQWGFLAGRSRLSCSEQPSGRDDRCRSAICAGADGAWSSWLALSGE